MGRQSSQSFYHPPPADNSLYCDSHAIKRNSHRFARNSYEIRTNFARISYEFHMTVTEFLPKPHPSALVDPHKASSGWCSWAITHPVQWLSFRLSLSQQCNMSGGIAYPK